MIDWLNKPMTGWDWIVIAGFILWGAISRDCLRHRIEALEKKFDAESEPATRPEPRPTLPDPRPGIEHLPDGSVVVDGRRFERK